MAHFYKFVSFLHKNNHLPFIIKKRVFDACLISAVLYGCESWLNGDLKPVSKIYNWSLKHLLGVRMNSCNDICYIESGYNSLSSIVRYKQINYFSKMVNERCGLLDDPLGYTLRLVLNSTHKTGNYLKNLATKQILFFNIFANHGISTNINSG